MSDYNAHLAAAREVQFALGASHALKNNSELLPPSALAESAAGDEEAARTIALRETLHLGDHPEAWSISPTPELRSRFSPIDAPDAIYGIGSEETFIRCLARPAVTIVGGANVPLTAKNKARSIATECTLARVPLILGMSNGVETHALRAVLDVPEDKRGPVAIVLGSSPTIPWPRNNADLYAQACAQGLAIVSRTPHVAPPITGSHHLRDRLRLPLVDAAVVIEARSDDETTQTFVAAAEHIGRKLLAFSAARGSATGALPNSLLDAGRAQRISSANDFPLWIVSNPGLH